MLIHRRPESQVKLHKIIMKVQKSFRILSKITVNCKNNSLAKAELCRRYFLEYFRDFEKLS